MTEKKSFDRATSKPSIEEAQLVELIVTIWQGKLWILTIAVIGTILGIFYSIRLPNVYEAKVTYSVRSEQPALNLGGTAALLGLADGSNSSLSNYKPILESTDLLVDFVNENSLLKPLFPECVDSVNNDWLAELKPEDIPTLLDGAALLRERISYHLNFDDKTISLSFQDEDPQVAYERLLLFAESFLKRVEQLERGVSDSALVFYSRKIQETDNFEVRKALAKQLVDETKKALMIGQSRFQVLDKARIPEVKSKPRRSLIVIASFFASCVLGMLWIFALSFMMDVIKALRERS